MGGRGARGRQAESEVESESPTRRIAEARHRPTARQGESAETPPARPCAHALRPATHGAPASRRGSTIHTSPALVVPFVGS